MEFPLFQGIVALACKAMGSDLDQTGRMVSLLFFYASLWILYLLILRLFKSRVCGYLAVSMALICPLYIFWSRTFMIESTALFFTLLYLLGVVSSFGNKETAWKITAGLAGITAALVKITTFTIALPLAGIFCLFWWENQKGRHFSVKTIRILAVMAVTYVVIPLAVAAAWTIFADGIKAQHPAAGALVSKNLTAWNFGTLQQKLNPVYWRDLVDRSIPYILPVNVLKISVLWPWAISLFWAALYLSGKHRIFFISFFATFMLGPIVYTNLYFVHEYYWYSNTLYFFVAVALVFSNLLKRPVSASIGRRILIPALVFFMISGYVRTLLPSQRYDASSSFVSTAQLTRQYTDPNGVLLCYGLAWDSSFPYYAQRRALMMWESGYLNVEEAFRQTGESNIQALVLGTMYPADEQSVKASLERFHLELTPIISQGGIKVYMRKDNAKLSPHDYIEAMNQRRLVAEQGDATAQFNLGIVYANGKGVPQNDVQAYAWIATAATQGYEQAAEVLSLIVKKMTPAQTEEGRRLSLEYAEKYIKK